MQINSTITNDEVHDRINKEFRLKLLRNIKSLNMIGCNAHFV